MSVLNTIPQKFSLLTNTGTTFAPLVNKTYKIDLNGVITIWDGVVGTLTATDLLVPGSDVYTPDVEFRWQMMQRNITILNNRSTQNVDMIDFIQGVWGAPGVETAEAISVALQINDLGGAARGAGDRVRIRLSTSATNPAAGVSPGVTLTATTGTVITGSATADMVVDAVTTGDIVVVATDALAGTTTSYIWMMKSGSDTTGTTVKRAVSAAVTFA